MKNLWSITNISDNKFGNVNSSIKVGPFSFFIDERCNFKHYADRNLYVLIDGFVLPRINEFDEFSSYDQNKLVFHLYDKSGIDFIKKIKGNFNIVIVDQNTVHIFNDHHSFKKFFIYQNGQELLISNQLDAIGLNMELEVDNEHVALFSLMQHFVDGRTMFKNTSYSEPASYLKIDIDSNDIVIDKYLGLNHFRTLENNNYNLDQFTDIWDKLIVQYVDYLKRPVFSIKLYFTN